MLVGCSRPYLLNGSSYDSGQETGHKDIPEPNIPSILRGASGYMKLKGWKFHPEWYPAFAARDWMDQWSKINLAKIIMAIRCGHLSMISIPGPPKYEPSSPNQNHGSQEKGHDKFPGTKAIDMDEIKGVLIGELQSFH